MSAINEPTDEMLQAAVAEAVKQGLLPRFAHGETEYLRNYERIKAVVAAAMQAA